MKRLHLPAALSFFAIGFISARGDAAAVPAPPSPPHIASFGGKEDAWHGFNRQTFQVDNCKCWVVEPKTPLPGKHWIWCLMFPDAYPDRTGALALLAKGYYFAYMSVGDTFGAPSALSHLDAFYAAMKGAGFRSKAALMGISRGGLYAYNWAARNPEKVSVIYGDAPVCNFASWPAHNPVEWKALLAIYGFKTNEEAIACPTQPIKELRPLAHAHIPLISVVGDVDTVVPYAENTALVEKKYQKLGGEIKVIHKPTCNHHPHGLDDPTPVVDFIMQHDW